MDENVRKKKHSKREVIISNNFYLAPEHYKYWPKNKLWTEHSGIREHMKELQSVDSIKSKYIYKLHFIIRVRFPQ